MLLCQELTAIALLDTGSQVTTVSASFYHNNLSEHPFSLLMVWTLRVLVAKMFRTWATFPSSSSFPKSFVETEPEVSTLALVVPDLRINYDLPVLVGTNALDVLYDEHCQGKNQTPCLLSMAIDNSFAHLSSGEK